MLGKHARKADRGLNAPADTALAGKVYSDQHNRGEEEERFGYRIGHTNRWAMKGFVWVLIGRNR